ncbi:hypothetical protein TNCT_419021 [Trichonephila clavata]|uniref:Uncharacterized protein n=1 Tax=Trichonephila clavata TaxID=2740835 RepID=A0A8X6FBM8_TRICU|nr:hypothetical protein TNCT_419021 [Trichonephila clavata]
MQSFKLICFDVASEALRTNRRQHLLEHWKRTFGEAICIVKVEAIEYSIYLRKTDNLMQSVLNSKASPPVISSSIRIKMKKR